MRDGMMMMMMMMPPQGGINMLHFIHDMCLTSQMLQCHICMDAICLEI